MRREAQEKVLIEKRMAEQKRKDEEFKKQVKKFDEEKLGNGARACGLIALFSMWLIVPSIIFSIIAIYKGIKGLNTKKRGAAIAGIVLGIIPLVYFGLTIVISIMNNRIIFPFL